MWEAYLCEFGVGILWVLETFPEKEEVLAERVGLGFGWHDVADGWLRYGLSGCSWFVEDVVVI